MTARRLGALLLAGSVLAAGAVAQPAQQRPAAPPTPRQAAPHDLTGYWVVTMGMRPGYVRWPPAAGG